MTYNGRASGQPISPTGQHTVASNQRQSYKPLMRSQDPPTFSGWEGNVSIYDFEEELRKFQMRNFASDEDIISQVLPSVLSGHAYRWFKTQMEYSPIRSMTDFFIRLRGHFEASDYYKRLKREFQARTQDIDESLSAYIIQINEYYHRLGPMPPEREIIQTIISRLNPDYLPYFKDASTLTSIVQFMAQAQSVDKLVATSKAYRRPPSVFLDESLGAMKPVMKRPPSPAWDRDRERRFRTPSPPNHRESRRDYEGYSHRRDAYRTPSPHDREPYYRPRSPHYSERPHDSRRHVTFRDDHRRPLDYSNYYDNRGTREYNSSHRQDTREATNIHQTRSNSYQKDSRQVSQS